MHVADLPEEFVGPVSHASLWLWIAVAAMAVMVLYYLAVTLWARPPRPPKPEPPAPRAPRPEPRAYHLQELARIEHEVATRQITAREGHQQVSATVRSFVGEVSHLPADKMSLSDLRRARAGVLTDLVALMYPPAFAPSEEGHAAELLPEALGRARQLVTRWT